MDRPGAGVPAPEVTSADFAKSMKKAAGDVQAAVDAGGVDAAAAQAIRAPSR